jgi:hypothetical protein
LRKQQARAGPVRTITKWMVAGVAAATLASCETAPPTHVAMPAPAPKPMELPYRWTQGNAPQAHKEMVAAPTRVSPR